ncbi:GntR family transcriptional regulator [Rhizobium sp. PAMB 3182]
MPDSLESFSTKAYLALEHQIVTLRLPPGASVNEKRLIDIAGQGRTPVREAIQRLAWQGLIIIRPRAGMEIRAIDELDFAKIMDVRLQLEPIAARLTAQYANSIQRAAIVDCAQQMTASAASGDVEMFLNADKRFDTIMEKTCPNQFLTGALAPLQTHARRIWFSTATPERMKRAISLHVAVINAIQRSLPHEAQVAMATLLSTLIAEQPPLAASN